MIKLKSLVPSEQKMIISEWLTYDQLVSSTQDNFPSRMDTTKNVKTTPPEFVMLRDGNLELDFKFRSQPSTEGRAHKGYIKFAPGKPSDKSTFDNIKAWWRSVQKKFKKFINKEIPPKIMSGEDIRKMKCKVACDCKDFKYRMEKANQMQGASDVHFSNGALPHVTNPSFEAGICKHLLGCLNHLEGNIELSEEK